MHASVLALVAILAETPPTNVEALAWLAGTWEGREASGVEMEEVFPKKILYWIDEAGALHARIEGDAPGKAQEWTWRKAAH